MPPVETLETKLLTYQTLFAEGIIFLNRALFKEAIDTFTTCLTLLAEIESPNDTVRTFIAHTLLHRSKAHLDIGGHSSRALADALKAFEMNQSDPFSLLAVAEAYYDSGEFEQALICFHRGLQIKPEWRVFEKGIHKCSSVIESALSGNTICKKHKQPPTGKIKPKDLPRSSKCDFAELEEINVDRIFMRELLLDKVFLEGIGSLKRNIQESVAFLESRVEFWRQKNMRVANERPSKTREKRARADLLVKSIKSTGLLESPVKVTIKAATLVKK